MKILSSERKKTLQVLKCTVLIHLTIHVDEVKNTLKLCNTKNYVKINRYISLLHVNAGLHERVHGKTYLNEIIESACR